jgi:predicted nucleic acid-binding Zn ribbon protein
MNVVPVNFYLVVAIQCGCQKEGQPYWVRIREWFHGLTGQAETTCPRCGRTVKMKMKGGAENIKGFYESRPGTNYPIESLVDVRLLLHDAMGDAMEL